MTELRAARTNLGLIFSTAALCGAMALLLLYRSAAAGGIYTGVYTCLNTLIPTLFPFVLLACVASRSRAAQVLLRPLAPVLRHAFHLPACAAPALVLGLTAGYPTGAKMTAALLEDGLLTREQAARLLCFCTAPGYAFAASYTGAVMLGRAHTGLLLFLSTALAPLGVGLVLARFAPLPDNTAPPAAPSGSFARAVRDGVSAMVTMCAFVVVFSAALSVLHSAGLFQKAANALAVFGVSVPDAGASLSFLLEVTAGVAHSAYWHSAPALIACGLGFGGLCVHLQIFSFFSGAGLPVKKSLYFLARAANALLCALFYRVLALLLPAAESASAGGAALSRTSASSAAGSIALLTLSLFFLLICARGDFSGESHTLGWKFRRRNATIEKTDG